MRTQNFRYTNLEIYGYSSFLSVITLVINVMLVLVLEGINLLAPELFFLILAHLYIKCE